MGHLIGAGFLDEKIVRVDLTKAAKIAGLDDEPGGDDAIQATIASGIKEGIKEPRGPRTNPRQAVSLEDFHAYSPMHNYIYIPTREPWPAASINARLGMVSLVGANGKPLKKKISASVWLDRNRSIEQMTWAPGFPSLIKDRLILDGGWIERAGVSCLNLYRSSTMIMGNAAEAGPWLEHMHKVFNEDDARHIIIWFAHRVQRPQEKINHAVVFIGAPGIGKDTAIEPVKRAIGHHNFAETSPQHMLGAFNGYLKSVILRVNEARDLGEMNRYQFYEHMKPYSAAPPDTLRVNEKNLREYYVMNCCGVIITSNYKTDGIYLPADDRRHHVAYSSLKIEDFADGYWRNLWRWLNDGGDRHVAAYLNELDISSFDAKEPPPKTEAFWEIVDANRAPEESELADVLDRLGKPKATTIVDVSNAASDDFRVWLRDRRNNRQIPHRLAQCEYSGFAMNSPRMVSG